MKKALLSVLVVGILAVATWAAASAYTGYQAKAGIEALTTPEPGSTPLRFSDLNHKQGVFGSSGTVTLHYPDPDATQQPRTDLFQMEITYTFDHRVAFENMLRFDWTASFIGSAEETMQETFGQNPELTGAGNWDWEGVAKSSYTIPALEAYESDEALVMSPVTGHVEFDQAALLFNLNMPTLLISSEDDTTRVSNIELELHAKDRFTGEGRSEFRVGDIEFAQGHINGLKIVANNSVSGNRVDISLDKSIEQLTVADTTVSDIRLALLFDDLYAPSVTALSAIMNTAGNLEHLTPTQQQVVQGALRDLFVYGFSVGVTDLSGETTNGSVTGQALATIKPADEPNIDPTRPFQFDGAKQLEMSAVLDVNGKAMAPQVMAIGLMFGVLVPSENGFNSSMSLSAGQLVINETVVPVAEELRQINQMITGALRAQ